jgi:Tol biopolymer transport system component
VLDIPGTAVFADWSPDGKRMLYQTQEPTKTGPQGPLEPVEIWTVRKNGNDPQLLEDDAAELTLLPRYSNDGERVVYVKLNKGNEELYSIKADGSGGKKRLTETAAVEWLERLLA